MIRIKYNWDPASGSNSERRVSEKILPVAFLSRTRSRNWLVVFRNRFGGEVRAFRNLPVANRRAALENQKFSRGLSSVGRAPQWHCGGQGFESPRLQVKEAQHFILFVFILGDWIRLLPAWPI